MERPQRKYPRLKGYDYSMPGYYYVTIHTKLQGNILSRVGQGCDPGVQLTKIGEVADQQLWQLETRFPSVRIDKYVIMPTHIHAIIRLLEDSAGAAARPTLMDVVGTYKSITTRECNRIMGTPGQPLFQASFYESVLRNEKAYQECWRYIDENPLKWALAPEDR